MQVTTAAALKKKKDSLSPFPDGRETQCDCVRFPFDFPH